MSSWLRTRTGSSVAFLAITVLLFHRGLIDAGTLAWNDSRYTQVLVIPFLSLACIWLDRERILRDAEYSRWAAVPAALAILFYFLSPGFSSESLFLGCIGVVLTWISGFVFFFGTRSAKAALFPLLLLLMAIPVPNEGMERLEVALQYWSADVTGILFRVAGTPVYRQGLVFNLPTVAIEVARECSGIRSAISLLITALLLGNFFLRSGWSKIFFVATVLPIAVFKNALRIAILSWLATYVSRDYLTGSLHMQGGPIFSIISLALLLPLLWGLRHREGTAVAS